MPTKLQEVTCKVLSNDNVAPRLYVINLECGDVVRDIKPGQFLHLKVPNFENHILRRPFSIYATDNEKGTCEILYQVVGSGTDKMTTLSAGDSLSAIMPIGTAWSISPNAGKVLLVGGGVGAAPLYMLCEKLLEAGVSVDVILGAQTKKAHVTLDKYRDLLGYEPFCSTDDGSYGRAGFCTTLVEDALQNKLDSESRASEQTEIPYDCVYVCGPPPLMKAVSQAAKEADVACQVSLERLMACGIGACLSCVVDTVYGKRRVCVNGPVFDAEDLIW